MKTESKKARFLHQECREYRGQRRVQDLKTRANRVERRSAKQALVPTVDELLADIAKDKLGIATLETQRSDGLDFHEVAVWQLRAALEAAFEAGKATKESAP